MPTYCITGANRGLGLEFVRQLAQSPDNTIIATTRSLSNDLSDLKSVASQTTHILECDTADQDSIQSFASSTKTALNGAQIDVLLNNAGANSVPAQTSLSLGAADLHREIDVNVLGPAKTTEFLIAQGLLSQDARIVNMTSGLGSMSVGLSITPRKCATYSISKAGVNMLTVHQSGDLREKLRGVVVICMDPGWVKTRMGGEGAMLEPEVSIGGMLKVVHGLGDGDNGKFYTYTGEEVKW